jgi:hypothetical protein
MICRSFLLAVTLLLGTAAIAPQDEAHSLVGTYSCVTRDTDHTTWRFTTVNAPFGAWLRLYATFAPQNGAPARTAFTYLGYDPSNKRWNIVSMSSGGSYYTRYSTSGDLNGSRWVDGYPADGGKAVIAIPSATEYTFTFSSLQDHSLTTCTRQP